MFGRRKAERRRLQMLKSLDLFAGCSDDLLRRIDGLGAEMTLRAGSHLLREGGATREFMVLLDGVAGVTSAGERVALLRPGDFVGEVAILSQRPWAAGVSAATTVRVRVLHIGEFYQLLALAPSVRCRIERTAADRLARGDVRGTRGAGVAASRRPLRLNAIGRPA